MKPAIQRIIGALALATLVPALAGCPAPNPVALPDFSTPAGDLAGADLSSVCNYPKGPYGTATNSVIANLGFQIKRNAMGAATAINLGDLHCNSDIKVLAILVSAEWCLPCQAEQPELVQLYSDYAAANKGVAFVEFIVQNNDHSAGDAATLDRWATKFKVNFDMGIDANSALAPFYDPNNFPSEMVIQTSDMTIQATRKGYMKDWLKMQIDGLLP